MPVRTCVGIEVDFERGEASFAGRTVAVRSAPISVDPDEFEGLAGSEAVLAGRGASSSERAPSASSSGSTAPTRPRTSCAASGRSSSFSRATPTGTAGSGMLALLDPSRQDIPEYAEYLVAIQRAARELNDRFATAGWTPLELRVGDDFPGSIAAYKQFDVLLVNAIFDGLNLVAKEAPLVNERDGVLVLSENAGAYEELGEWALGVNPFDVAGQARALHEALSMAPGERTRRREALCRWVREHDIERWIEFQLDAIDEAAERAGRTLEAR